MPEEETIAEDEQHDEAEEIDDDDCFFESLDRVPSGISFDLDHPSSGSDSDDDDEDVRISFASAMEAPRFSICVADLDDYFYDDNDDSSGLDFGIWMAEPVSLAERRRRLLHGMGLTSKKDLAPSKSRHNPKASSLLFPPPLPLSSATAKPAPSALVPPPSLPKSASLVRSLSDSHTPFQAQSATGIDRTLSWPPSQWLRPDISKKGVAFGAKAGSKKESGAAEAEAEEAGAGACKIKNLDNGKEFVVSEVGKDGTCGRLNDVQTGMQLTMDEFERFLGFSPIVKELMRRVNLGEDKKKKGGGNGNSTGQAYGGKSSKSGARKTGNWLKNIKFVASSVTGLISEKERCHGISASAASGGGFGGGKSSLNWNSSDWLKVHQHGKTYKELTGLYMCQEIQAHRGSIWCMRFSSDGRFLASAGEDRTVRVWQVMQSDTFLTTSSMRRQELRLSAASQALNLSASSRMEQAAILGSHASKRTGKKSKLGSKKRSLPDYVVLPDTIFSISETPFCSFEGHLDDVLDLSWSKSQVFFLLHGAIHIFVLHFFYSFFCYIYTS